MKNLFLCVLSTLFISTQILAQCTNCANTLSSNNANAQSNVVNCLPVGQTINYLNANGGSAQSPTIVCVEGNLNMNWLNINGFVEIHNYSDNLQLDGINVNNDGKFVNHGTVLVNNSLNVNGQLTNNGNIIATNVEVQVNDNGVFENNGNLDPAKKITVNGRGVFKNTGTTNVTEFIKVQTSDIGQLNNEGNMFAPNAQVEVTQGLFKNKGNLDPVKRIAVKSNGTYSNAGTTNATEDITIQGTGVFTNSETGTTSFSQLLGDGNFSSENSNINGDITNFTGIPDIPDAGGVEPFGEGEPIDLSGGDPVAIDDDLWKVKLMPQFNEHTSKEFITTSKHLLVGDFVTDGVGNANAMILTRHVNGKHHESNDFGELNLNWHGGNVVNIGAEASDGNKSDLNVYGNAQFSGGNIGIGDRIQANGTHHLNFYSPGNDGNEVTASTFVKYRNNFVFQQESDGSTGFNFVFFDEDNNADEYPNNRKTAFRIAEDGNSFLEGDFAVSGDLTVGGESLQSLIENSANNNVGSAGSLNVSNLFTIGDHTRTEGDITHNEFSIRNGNEAYFKIDASDNVVYLGKKDYSTGDPTVKVRGNLFISANWEDMPTPDYVFDDNYDLRSIQDLKGYIEQNGHLPGVVSAKEVKEADHLNVVDFSFSLLEKIEELTLYTMDQEERIVDHSQTVEEKNSQIKNLESRLNELENLVNQLVEKK